MFSNFPRTRTSKNGARTILFSKYIQEQGGCCGVRGGREREAAKAQDEHETINNKNKNFIKK